MPASDLKSIKAIQLQTRRELILGELRQAISSGQLAPGTHLAEIELSEALGVSRGTLREALRHLQQEGLLSADARGRLFVRVVNAQEVEDIFAVRCALETLAFRQICASPRRADIATELRRQLEKLRAAEGDFVGQMEADLTFHDRMCELSGNETLHTTWRSVSGLSRAASTAAGPDTALRNMGYDRHLPIIRLMEAGDLVGGEDFLSSHMADAAAHIVERMNRTEAAS